MTANMASSSRHPEAVELYIAEIFHGEHAVDRTLLLDLANPMTLGRATPRYLVELGLIKNEKDFSKVSTADAYSRLKLQTPDETAPMLTRCLEITRALRLGSD